MEVARQYEYELLRILHQCINSGNPNPAIFWGHSIWRVRWEKEEIVVLNHMTTRIVTTMSSNYGEMFESLSKSELLYNDFKIMEDQMFIFKHLGRPEQLAVFSSIMRCLSSRGYLPSLLPLIM